MLLSTVDVAKYFLSKDKDGSLFTKNLANKNNRVFYDGNARLNKYLHLAQNIYIAKTGKPLMDAVFYAYDNGAVIPEVQEKYSVLLAKRNDFAVEISKEEKNFLDKFYTAFQNAELDELIDLSHEDDEWTEKSRYYKKEDQKMDSMKYADVYKEQYHDIVQVLDRM